MTTEVRCQVTHESSVDGRSDSPRCEEARRSDGRGWRSAATPANVVQQYHGAPMHLERPLDNHSYASPPYNVHHVPCPSPPHYAAPPYAPQSMPHPSPVLPSASPALMSQPNYSGDSIDMFPDRESCPYPYVGQSQTPPPVYESRPSNEVQSYTPHAQQAVHNAHPIYSQSQQVARHTQAHQQYRPPPDTTYQAPNYRRSKTTARISEQMRQKVDAVIARVTQAATTNPRSSDLSPRGDVSQPRDDLEPGMGRPVTHESQNVLYRNTTPLNTPGVIVTHNGIAPRITVPTAPAKIARRMTVASKAYDDSASSPVGTITRAPRPKRAQIQILKRPSVRPDLPAPTTIQADTREQSNLENVENIWAYPSPDLPVSASLSSSSSPTALLSPIKTLASKEITMIKEENQRESRRRVAETNASARQSSVPPRSITPAIGPVPASIASSASAQKGSSAVTTAKLDTSTAGHTATRASASTTNDDQGCRAAADTSSDPSGEQSGGATNGLSTSFMAAMAPKFNIRELSCPC